MALTDTEIRKSKPQTKNYDLRDGGGLYVSVTPAGGKLWRWKYRYEGKEKLMSFGKYPEVTLVVAREKELGSTQALGGWGGHHVIAQQLEVQRKLLRKHHVSVPKTECRSRVRNWPSLIPRSISDRFSTRRLSQLKSRHRDFQGTAPARHSIARDLIPLPRSIISSRSLAPASLPSAAVSLHLG